MLLDGERSSSSVEASAEEITLFVQQLAREYLLDIPDRRSEPRYQITIPVNVRSVGNTGHLGPPVHAVTRDLSQGGIGFISQDPLNGKLKVQLVSPSGAELSALAQVVRCKPNGYYFDIGCEFLGLEQ